MIPLKLTLRNFLCYGDNVPTLDLDGIHVACLCGQNGHGKSALLDAITWALWGKARGRSQDELIRYGYDEMLVDLEFMAQDTHYRVTRRHSSSGTSRRRQSATDLQLQVHTGADFHPITGNSVRETQAKVDQVTGMDYDTFINSAFLLQGRADEFTNKTPGERKEVLAKVLGLGFYDQLQDRAKERADEKRGAASSTENDLERMRRELSRADGYQTELEAVTGELEKVGAQIETGKQSVDALKKLVEDLRRKRGELEEIAKRIPQVEGDISYFHREIADRQGRIADYQALIPEKDAIEAGVARLHQARDRYEELNRSRESFDRLVKRRSDLENAVGSAKARLEEQVSHLKRRIEVELGPRAGAASSITGKLDESRTRLEELAKDEGDIAGRRQRLQDLAAQTGELKAIGLQLEAEGAEIRSKLDMVQGSQEGVHCPLCDSELGSQGYQRLLDSYDSQITEKRHRYRDNQSVLKDTEKESLGLDKELPRLEAALRADQRKAQSNVAVLESQLEDSHNAVEQMEQASRDLAQGKRALEQELYATQEREELAELDGQVGALGYDQATHRRLYDEMQELQPFEERDKRLAEAVASLPQELESLARSQDMYQHRQEDLLTSRARQREIEAEASELPGWEDKLRWAETAYRELESRHTGLFRRQVELEGELKKLETLEADIGGKEKLLKTLREEQGIYQELVEAFGRRGVQAMLIETVLPRIEEEATALLGRMTDNRMHLKLESQRERKSRKGEPIETLEIKISDEMGPRSYELFSGGEAFRINLALRIALSKVLAHRRGAPLPTLFIDEGFGTQDAAGRERILDVIRAIEDDFQRIIVITHLDELKEVFPARIEVQKEEAGSTFWISYA